MMKFVVNPGSGPVSGARENDAYDNVVALLRDAGVEQAVIRRSPNAKDDTGGRFAYNIDFGGRTATVEMPGIRLDLLRWVGAPGQNIWDFPRLYVDGSSWVWKFAVGELARALTGTEDEE